MRYQHYVSLGHNCEIAFQFRRILGRDSSSFFSWNITPLSSLISLFKGRFVGILQADNLSQHGDGSLVWDKSYDFAFHSPFSTPVPHDDPEFAVKLVAFREKTHYLVEKFYSTARSGDSVAYFYKADEVPVVRKEARALRNLLNEIHVNNDFNIIFLQPEDRAEPDWGEPGLANRYLKRLAPWYDATDGHVSSYDKVFLEFPHVENMRFSGY